METIFLGSDQLLQFPDIEGLLQFLDIEGLLQFPDIKGHPSIFGKPFHGVLSLELICGSKVQFPKIEGRPSIPGKYLIED